MASVPLVDWRGFFSLEEYAHVVRAYGRFAAQILPVVPATAFGPFVTTRAAHQTLRVLCEEADPKVDKLSKVAYPPAAGSSILGTGDMYNGGLDGRN